MRRYSRSALGRGAVEVILREAPVVFDTLLVQSLCPPFLDQLPVLPATRRFTTAAARLRAVIDAVVRRTTAPVRLGDALVPADSDDR
ncbi:hypothetical protein ABZ769_27375 [Streptomyces olivoreticuli]